MTTREYPGSSGAAASGSEGAAALPKEWTDRKKYAWLLSLLPAAIPLIIWGVNSWFTAIGTWAWLVHAFWWVGPIAVFILIPIGDFVMGRDGENVPEEFVPWLEETKFYRIVSFLYFPLMFASLIASAYLWTSSDPAGVNALTVYDKIGLAWSMGMTSGIGIVAAHELGHKKAQFERWLGKLTLAVPAYGHFLIEHNKGHHVQVATPEDPVSARMGENVYSYLIRSIPHQIPRAWDIEKKRLARKGKSQWNLDNDVLNAWLVTIALWAVMIIVFGIGVLPYMLLQAVLGIMLLEVVNYLEHYGLLRHLKRRLPETPAT